MESKTWRDLKLRQRETPVGDAVPIVRCDQHTIRGVPTHLNLTFGGDIFSSGAQWEEEFRDTLGSLYLLAPKLIFGDVRRIPDRVEARPSKATHAQLDLGPVATALPSDPWQDGASDDTFGELLA